MLESRYVVEHYGRVVNELATTKHQFKWCHSWEELLESYSNAFWWFSPSYSFFLLVWGATVKYPKSGQQHSLGRAVDKELCHLESTVNELLRTLFFSQNCVFEPFQSFVSLIFFHLQFDIWYVWQQLLNKKWEVITWVSWLKANSKNWRRALMEKGLGEFVCMLHFMPQTFLDQVLGVWDEVLKALYFEALEGA